MFARARAPKKPQDAPKGPVAGGNRALRGPGAIELVNLTKSYPSSGSDRKYVVRNVTTLFPARTKVALLGANGSGKSTLLRVIAGLQDVDSGRVRRYGTVSWPIGFAGSFHPELTGAQNIRFVARVHGVDTEELQAFVYEFSELGDYFFMPFRTYSAGMKSRLAFGCSMGVPFDCYLMDEVTSTGDASFKEKCAETFENRLAGAAAILATHSMGQAKRICDMGMVLKDGALHIFADVEEAIALYRKDVKSRK